MTIQETLLQWVPAGATTLCVWFIYRSLADFKDFKSKSDKKFEEMERLKLDTMSKLSGINLLIGERVDQLKDLHAKYEHVVSSSIHEINVEMGKFQERSSITQEFYKRALDVMAEFGRRQTKQADQIQSLRIEVGKHAVLIKGTVRKP